MTEQPAVVPAGEPGGDGPVPGGGPARRTYFGRQGSPEITVAFPFAKVEVTRADEALRASTVAALQAVDALAEQVLALSEAGSKAERNEVATAIHSLRAELDEVITTTATASDR